MAIHFSHHFTARLVATISLLLMMLLLAPGAAAQSDRGKAFVGNSSSKKYHRPTCRSVKKIDAANRVEFATSEEAEKSGYKACKVCLRKKSRRSSK